ncbi:MAG: lysylphosphatidylglycerol synthase transmembrane domain-containing protein [Anaerolineae bacterium]|nr:lysylphosphatidylglycerol synthase transmembrane domain-containing protein [Anaerolineae bacterium]
MSKFGKDAKRWLPGALVSLILIGIILYFVDFRRMGAALREANYLILLLALPMSFIWLAVRGIVWRTLLQNRVSYRDVFLTVGEGYLMNNFLPFRLGEIGRALLLSRKSDLQFMEVIPTIVIERSVDLVFSAAILLVSLPFVVSIDGAGPIGITVGAAVLLSLIMLYLLARNRQWAVKTFYKLSQRWHFLQKVGDNFITPFLNGLEILTDGWLFARFLFWMTINWGIAIGSYYLIVRAFFPQAQLFWGFFGLGVAAFGNAIPSLPGAIGTFEGAFGGALTLLTGDQSTALAAALAGRLYNYISSIVVGLIGFAGEGQTLSGIYQQIREFREKLGNS